ncbi:MAG: M20/M25/M40 family metallo-hydrolase [Candidatus Dormibacteria bacterium]
MGLPGTSPLTDIERRVLEHIDANAGAYIEELQRLVQIPSVSAHARSIDECAAAVGSLLTAAGAEAEELPGPGFPVILGHIRGESERTLLLYNHYDVQPPEPLDLWHSEPFAAEVHDGRMVGRGVADDKGSLVARICAVRALRETVGLPVSVKFLVEGEEEVGSVRLPEVLRTCRDRIAADACVWEGGWKDTAGRPIIYFGAKGMLYVQLDLRLLGGDLHSSRAAIMPSAAWRLVWALAGLKGEDERVLVEGFYDDVRPPDPAELAALDPADFDAAGELATTGAAGFVLGLGGEALVRKYIFEPTCNIAGFGTGYTGPGLKTVLPAAASAKLDFRLVPGQDPDRVLALLRRHLDRGGFQDIAITVLSSEKPARSSPDSTVGRAFTETIGLVTDQRPILQPMMPATGPMHWFTDFLGLELVSGECAAGIDSNVHAPNEWIRVSDYLEGIRHFALALLRYRDLAG